MFCFLLLFVRFLPFLFLPNIKVTTYLPKNSFLENKLLLTQWP